MKKRVMVVSHAHPDFSKGGGEIAAYNLFTSLKLKSDLECIFVGVHGSPANRGSIFSVHKSDEILLHTRTNHQNFSNMDLANVSRQWRDFVDQWSPEVVHFHHYTNIGVELLRVTRQAAPKSKILLTLHEYAAICHHHGQMVKTGSYKLCLRSSSTDCHRCFPQIIPDAFVAREYYLKANFEAVDTFIAPSVFLKERYVDWGIPSEKILPIENLAEIDSNQVRLHDKLPPPSNVQKLVFGYFGQINPYKGVIELLTTFKNLRPEVKSLIELKIHGANLESQPNDFQAQIRSLIEGCGQFIENVGQYERSQLSSLLLNVHYVVVPSIWWENSPLVIQEAHAHGRPTIVRAIGGMKEKNLIPELCFAESGSESLGGIVNKVVSGGEWSWQSARERIDLIRKDMVRNAEEALIGLHL